MLPPDPGIPRVIFGKGASEACSALFEGVQEQIEVGIGDLAVAVHVGNEVARFEGPEMSLRAPGLLEVPLIGVAPLIA